MWGRREDLNATIPLLFFRWISAFFSASLWWRQGSFKPGSAHGRLPSQRCPLSSVLACRRKRGWGSSLADPVIPQESLHVHPCRIPDKSPRWGRESAKIGISFSVGDGLGSPGSRGCIFRWNRLFWASMWQWESTGETCNVFVIAYSETSGGCCWLCRIKSVCLFNIISLANVPLCHHNTTLSWPMAPLHSVTARMIHARLRRAKNYCRCYQERWIDYAYSANEERNKPHKPPFHTERNDLCMMSVSRGTIEPQAELFVQGDAPQGLEFCPLWAGVCWRA